MARAAAVTDGAGRFVYTRPVVAANGAAPRCLMRSPWLCVPFVAALSSALACDAAVSATTGGQAAPNAGVMAANVQTDVKLDPHDLDLESINYLVKKGKVKDAESLEKYINNPKEKMHSIDLDKDGKLDKIQIVEVKKPNDEIVFELHVFPSGKLKDKEKPAGVLVATLDFVPDKTTGQMVVKATYAPCVVGWETIVYDYVVPIVVQNGVIVVSEGPAFFGWLFAVRPVYVGVIAPVFKVKGKFKGKGKGKW